MAIVNHWCVWLFLSIIWFRVMKTCVIFILLLGSLRNPINLFAKSICKDLSMSTEISPLCLWRICFKANFSKYNIGGFPSRATVPSCFLFPPQQRIWGPLFTARSMIFFICFHHSGFIVAVLKTVYGGKRKLLVSLLDFPQFCDAYQVMICLV